MISGVIACVAGYGGSIGLLLRRMPTMNVGIMTEASSTLPLTVVACTTSNEGMSCTFIVLLS